MTDLECAHDGCAASIPNHQWGKIKADGWFGQKDGTVWCPAHVPAWVAEWRARRASTVGGNE